MSFDLRQFLPYRLSVLTNTVSTALARFYASDYQMSISEWRVMAALGMRSPVSAEEIVEITRLDKVSVSRAVSRLLQAGRVLRSTDSRDRRRSSLKLSSEGQRIHALIVPQLSEYEQELLAVLSVREQKQLAELLNRLNAQAERLRKDHPGARRPAARPLKRRTA